MVNGILGFVGALISPDLSPAGTARHCTAVFCPAGVTADHSGPLQTAVAQPTALSCTNIEIILKILFHQNCLTKSQFFFEITKPYKISSFGISSIEAEQPSNHHPAPVNPPFWGPG